MKIVFSKSYEPLRSKVMHFIENFEIQGLQLGTPKRNSIKVFDSDGLKLNIKSFKIHHFFRLKKVILLVNNLILIILLGICRRILTLRIVNKF